MGVSPEVEVSLKSSGLSYRSLTTSPSAAPNSLPLVFLHGFSQNSLCVGELTHLFGRSGIGELIAVDLPGHGASRFEVQPDLWATADLIAETTAEAIYVGYSMGGRVALHLALTHPASVKALVLIGATAGIEDDTLRADRLRADAELADRIERVGLERFVSEWLDGPLFSRLPTEARFESERLFNDRSQVAASLRRTGTGSMDPLWDRLTDIACPVLVLAGEYDERYCTIGRRMAAIIGPNAELVIIPDAGHSVHLEQPELTASVIDDFIDRRV